MALSGSGLSPEIRLAQVTAYTYRATHLHPALSESLSNQAEPDLQRRDSLVLTPLPLSGNFSFSSSTQAGGSPPPLDASLMVNLPRLASAFPARAIHRCGWPYGSAWLGRDSPPQVTSLISHKPFRLAERLFCFEENRNYEKHRDLLNGDGAPGNEFPARSGSHRGEAIDPCGRDSGAPEPGLESFITRITPGDSAEKSSVF